MVTKEEVLAFIATKNLAVIATADTNNKPQAAVVEFCEQDDFTILIDTLDHSRKYANLQTNQNVAIVIGWDEDITVQIDAIATELSGEALEAAKERYFEKIPRARKWADKPGIAYFAFKPVWMRYSDVSKHPWLIEEFTF